MITIEKGQYEREGFRLKASFTIGKGAFTSIIGPSGAGKSTLLNIIAGFDYLRSGTITLDGEECSIVPPARRPISFVFQDNNCFAHLTARNNVALGVSPNLRLDPEQWQAVDTALRRVGIFHLAPRRPGEMSGGERQRIALARVLVRRKPILLLDEPFAALGPALRQDMAALLKALQHEHNLTVVLVTHQPEDAKAFGGQVMFVDDGQVSLPVAATDFFKSTEPAIKAYLGV